MKHQSSAGSMTMRMFMNLVFCLLVCGYGQVLVAGPQLPEPVMGSPVVTQRLETYLLAQNAEQGGEKNLQPPVSGSLILPGSNKATDTSEKKCMTVCAQWGEECSYINRGSAGTTRSCRRTCQQYKEECF